MTETTKQALKDAMMLCQWIAETPHQRGSINGLAAQVQHASSAALASSTQPTSAVQPAPYAYAVYFPDQPTEELVHDLEELCDDMTNREHTITKLYDHPPTPGAVELVPCQRSIADIRNPVVKSGYMCVKCGALFSAADHDAATPPPSN